MPWYKFEITATEARAQFIAEFELLRQQYAATYAGVKMFQGADPNAAAAFYIAPDAESFAQQFIEKYGGVSVPIPTSAEVRPVTGSFDDALKLLRAPVVNRQVVEDFLKMLTVDVTPDTPSDDCPWAYLVSKKGSPRNIAVFATIHQPHTTVVQIWSLLDTVQKKALQSKDEEEKDAFYAGLHATLINRRARFGIVEPAALLLDDIAGRMLVRMHVDIPDGELTPRSLWEAMAATVESFELSEKFVNAHLGVGLRTTPSMRLQ